MGDRFGLPDLGVGVGLRTVHFGHILSKKPDVDFYEALTENFLDTGGRPLHVLDRVAERTPRRPARRLDVDRRDRPPRLRLPPEGQGARGPDEGALGLGPPLLHGRHGAQHPRPPAAALHGGDAEARHAAREDRLGRPRAAARAREPVDLPRVPGVDDSGVDVLRPAAARRRLRDAPRRQQRLRELRQPRLRPRHVPRRPPPRPRRPVPPRRPHGQGDAPPRHAQRAREGRGLEPLPPRERPHRARARRSSSGTRTSRTSRPSTPRRRRRSPTGRRSRSAAGPPGQVRRAHA